MRRALLATVLIAAVGLPSRAGAVTEPGTSSNLQLIGHDPLFKRDERLAGLLRRGRRRHSLVQLLVGERG